MAKKQKPSASKAATAAAEEGKKRKEEPKKEPEESESEEESEEEEEESEEEAESEEEEEEAESEEEEEEENEDEEEEGEDEASKKETLRKLLEPFSKEQMIDFLKDAALKDRKILSRITERADTDPVHRKIFIHGLGWDATTEQVLNVFKPYGEIQECKVVTDKLTGRAKGYGFVLFATRKNAKKALKQPQKKIGNRMTSSQLASAGPVNASGGKTGNAGLQAANSGPAPGLALQQQQQPKQPELGMSYVSPGLYVPAAAAPGIMVGQNAGIGLANPLLLSGIGTTVTPQSLGISGTYGNVNSVSPSVISNYSQLGLQGLGAYSQNQSQSPASGGAGAAIGGAGAASRQQSGYGSVGTSYSSYFGNR